MFPLENPYPLDANEHYIGPIFISQPQPLSDRLASFLDSHKKVVYVAFGQMYTPTQHEFNALAQALLISYRHGIIDGFIWATVGLPTSMLDIFQSNRTINSLGFANNPDFLFEQWVPQYSILNHTSTKLFISHAGTASTHEAVFNGVPILAHPFSSDQPVNALQLEKAGVALVNDRKTCTAESISRKIKTILKDQYSEFVTKANELRGLAHIASRRKSLAADLIEQLALYSRQGKAWFYQQDEPTHTLFTPSWRKLCLIYIAIKVGSLGVRVFRNQMGEMAYRKLTQGRDLVYTQSKKLQ
jgi:UDP-glucoronosyl and UDP-glucosyl transferase